MTVRDFLEGVQGNEVVYVLRPEYSNEGAMSIEDIHQGEEYKLAGDFYCGFNPVDIEAANDDNRDLFKIYTEEEVENLEVSWFENTYDDDFLVHTSYATKTKHACRYGECHNDNKKSKLCDYCAEHNISAEDCRNIWNILNLD